MGSVPDRIGSGAGRYPAENRPQDGHQKPRGGKCPGGGVNLDLLPPGAVYSPSQCKEPIKPGQRVCRPHPENLLPLGGAFWGGFGDRNRPSNYPPGFDFSPFGPKSIFADPGPYRPEAGIGFEQTGFAQRRVGAGCPLGGNFRPFGPGSFFPLCVQ